MDWSTAESMANHAIVARQALQKTKELATLIQILDILKPQVVVEIGMHRGGTMWAWSQVAPPGATLIGIDLPEGSGGTFDASVVGRTEMVAVNRGQEFRCLIGDSHSEAMLKALTKELDGRLIDFLFIDGDHSYAAVHNDYKMYSPLARFVALHDILDVKSDAMGDMGVHKLWRQLRTEAQAFEICEDLHLPEPVSGTIPYAGIGCIIPDGKHTPEFFIADRCFECLTTSTCLIKGKCRLYHSADHEPI